jgi:transglutaminase-like putative cysteine protease
MSGKKNGGARIVLKVILIVILLAIVYLALPYINDVVNNPPSAVNYTIPARMNFTIVREITIDASGTYTMNITIPRNDTFQQVYVSGSISDPDGYSKSEKEEYGRLVWSFHLNNSATAVLRYEGITYAKVWNIESSGKIEDIPESWRTKYNHREYIEVYNKTTHSYQKKYVIDPYPFENLTKKVTGNDEDVVGKLRSIYDVIVENFHYNSQRSGAPRTAVEVWNSKQGDCDELSFVFVSMARSIGIPAWVEYGLLYTGSTWVPHGWVGTVIPTSNGLVSVTIDLTVEVGSENFGRGFLIRQADRLLEWRADGNSEHLTSYYSFIRGYYTHLSVEQNFNVIKAENSGTIVVSSGEHKIPGWLILLILGLIFVAIIALIIRL